MRDRSEILEDAISARNKGTISKRYPEEVSLLTLEALVDIRDHLSTSIDVLRSLRDEIHELP